jgi:hypothetical protein
MAIHCIYNTGKDIFSGELYTKTIEKKVFELLFILYAPHIPIVFFIAAEM